MHEQPAGRAPATAAQHIVQQRQQGERLAEVQMLHTFVWRVDDHREEVDPPLGGDSTRLGLEPRSHRQLLPLELRQHVLDENVKW